MKKALYAWTIALGVGLAATLPVQGVDVKVYSSQGQPLTLDVAAEDSFLDVMGYISQTFVAENEAKDQFEDIIVCDLSSLSPSLLATKAARSQKTPGRQYQEALSASEKEDILYILRTLANSNLIKIATLTSPLKKAGARIEHLHPFKFLECVFNDEELKVCLRNLQGRSWVWKEFLNGLVRSFNEESNLNNIKPHTQAFTQQINIDPKIIQPAIQGHRWDELINTLIRQIPRQGAVNRYNM